MTVNTKVAATEYTECQAFYPVFRIGSSLPLTSKRVLPPFWPNGGPTRLQGRGKRTPFHDGTDTLVLWYILIPLQQSWVSIPAASDTVLSLSAVDEAELNKYEHIIFQTKTAVRILEARA